MKFGSLFAAAIFLAACSPAAAPPPQQAQIPPAVAPAPAGCTAVASRDWSAVGSQYYVIEAEASGATCPDAVATLRIKTTDGQIIFTHDYPVREVTLAFNPNNDQTGLRSDLDVWTRNTSDTQAANSLPPWPANAERPANFQPAVSRRVYEAARGNQSALFCFPDGGESNACVAVAGTTATYLGSLTPESE